MSDVLDALKDIPYLIWCLIGLVVGVTLLFVLMIFHVI